MQQILANYRHVLAHVRQVARECGRNPDEVELVAVSKTHPAAAVRALEPAAPVILGENRVQEALDKMAEIPDRGQFHWHLIGHLQTNKVNRAAEAFDMIHSVDSERLLIKLERRCAELQRILPVLIEVNVGGESSKSGCRVADVPAVLEAGCELTHVRIEGLMTVPPFLDDPEEVRPFFRQLREMRDRMQDRFAPRLQLPHLSMGMSHDYSVAIQEGATLVRVGTAIFGHRFYGAMPG